jgi:hypothetical protein
VKIIEGREITLVNLEEKVLSGITRGDLINYYTKIFLLEAVFRFEFLQF